MLFYDEIDQFMESAIYDMSVESDLGVYDDDMFEEGVFDKVKGFFQLGTQRSRELDEELKRISVVHAGEGIPSDKSWSTVLKILQVLLKLSVVGDMISIGYGTIIMLLTSLLSGTMVGASELGAGLGLVTGVSVTGLTIPVFILTGVLSVIIYKLLNKLINQGLEDDAVRRGSSVISFMKGIRNNVAKRNPAQAKQIDSDIGKLKSLLEDPYTESYALEDADLYSGSRGLGLQLTASQGLIRIIRCVQSSSKLLNAIDNRGTVDNTLIAAIDKHIKVSLGLCVGMIGGFMVGLTGFAVFSLIGMIVALITSVLAIVEGYSFTMKVKSMASNTIDQINALAMKTKDPATRSSLIEYRNEIVAAMNATEKDPDTHIVYNY